MRVGLEAGERVRDPAVRGRDRRDPGARPAGELGVEPAGIVQHLERGQRRRGLAAGAAQVGLERVSESAVGVPVAAQCGEHRIGAAPEKQHRVPVPVHEAGG